MEQDLVRPEKLTSTDTYMIIRCRAPNRVWGKHTPLLLAIFAALVFTGCEFPNDAVKSDPAGDMREIRDLMMNQERDWNAGDVNGYMKGYLKSDSLRFASGGAYRYGWQATLERYLDTYPDRDAMGVLTFSDVKINVLSPDWAMAFGAWNLKRGGEYKDIGGLYTLLLVRTEEGWRIKFDHTSSRS